MWRIPLIACVLVGAPGALGASEPATPQAAAETKRPTPPAPSDAVTASTPEAPSAATSALPSDVAETPNAVTGTVTPILPTAVVEPSVDDQKRAELEGFESEVDRVSSKLNGIKDQVTFLKNVVLGGSMVRASGDIRHLCQLGGDFTIERVRYTVDGNILYSDNEGSASVNDDTPFVLLSGPMTAGTHKVEVEVTIQQGGFGVFTYARGYGYQIRGTFDFKVIDGQVNQLTVVVYRKPDVTLEEKDRLAIRFDVVRADQPGLMTRTE
jgi:hypothetical protein